MNIAFVITRANLVGGASAHVRDLARGMMDRGHQVTVLGGINGDVKEDYSRVGVPFRTLRWLCRDINPVKDVLSAMELRRTLAELRPDLVHTHTAKAGLVGRWAAHRLKIPAIYTPHGWSVGDRVSSRHAWIFRAAERSVVPFSASIINVCDADRELARKYQIAPDAKLAVIHNGVHDISAQHFGQPDRSPVRLMMVARFECQKDQGTLLKALATLMDLPWTVELVGGGPLMKEAQGLAAQLGVADRVVFTGSANDVEERLAKSQICVLSSIFEGFPLTVLEGMRAGLPVIASDVGGVREAIVDRETGFVVKPSDPNALAESLRKLIVDPALRARFGRAGRNRYETHFTFEQMLDRTVALYESALYGSPDVSRTAAAPAAVEVARGR